MTILLVQAGIVHDTLAAIEYLLRLSSVSLAVQRIRITSGKIPGPSDSLSRLLKSLLRTG